MTKQYLYILLFCTLSILACKNESSTKNQTISYIKKEVVHTIDGEEIPLGGDSIAKIFYLIRHAEKDTAKGNPFLSKDGEKRAANLTKIMRQTFLDAVYTTYTNRTLQTVDSITQYKGLSNNIYTNTNMKATFIEAEKNPDFKRFLVVGHSNTIPPLANYLYGKQHYNKVFDEKEYDNFIIVVQKIDSTRKIFEFKY